MIEEDKEIEIINTELFSTVSYIKEHKQEDIQQVRNWKNNVIKIRDSYKGTQLFDTWDLEAKRILEFLNKFNQ